MNPLTNVKNTQKLNETELELGLVGSKSSWHEDFKDSAWIFVGGLPYDLTEGDVICVFSQYGEIVHINLVRDKQTGKSKGFCFICYEDQRSTILAVDNLNSIKLLGRTLRVNHVAEYKMPKEHEDDDEVTLKLREEGCAPRVADEGEDDGKEDHPTSPAVKKSKKEKKKKKDKKKKKRKSHEVETTSEQGTTPEVTGSRSSGEAPSKIKQERHDPGYDKYSRHVDRDGSKSTDIVRQMRKDRTVKSEPGRDRSGKDHHGHSSDKYRQQNVDRKGKQNIDVKLSRIAEYSDDERQHSGSSRSRERSSDDVKYQRRSGHDEDGHHRREGRLEMDQDRYTNSPHSRNVDRYHESGSGKDQSDFRRRRGNDSDYSSRYDDHDSSCHRTIHNHSLNYGRDHYEKDCRIQSPRRAGHRSRSPHARSERMKITVEIEK